MLDKIGIAKRIAKEVKNGYYVNLGIGIPTLVANYVCKDIEVDFQSENGVLGMGPFPFEGEEDADAAPSTSFKAWVNASSCSVMIGLPSAAAKPASKAAFHCRYLSPKRTTTTSERSIRVRVRMAFTFAPL